MVAVLRSFFHSVQSVFVFSGANRTDQAPMIGAYSADYSEVSEAEIAEANASCEALFKEGTWISINQKS